MNAKNELVRNSTGFILLATGLVTMGYAHQVGFDKMVEIGAGLISAGLYAFQHRNAPDAPASPKI
jgi:hypothetical protein